MATATATREQLKLRPIGDKVIAQRLGSAEKTKSGLYLPDSAQEKPEEGEVLAVGTGRFVEDKDSKDKVKKKTFVKTTLKPGERILYKKHAAREVEGDDEALVLVREEDVLGYLS